MRHFDALKSHEVWLISDSCSIQYRASFFTEAANSLHLLFKRMLLILLWKIHPRMFIYSILNLTLYFQAICHNLIFQSLD